MKACKVGVLVAAIVTIWAITSKCRVLKSIKNFKPGGSITLPCDFKKPMNIFWWTRNDIEMLIGGRYQYLSDGGPTTKKCTLKIKNAVTAEDEGTWTCGYREEIHLPDKQWESYLLKPVQLIGNEVEFGIPPASENPARKNLPIKSPRTRSGAAPKCGRISEIVIAFSIAVYVG